MAEAHVAVAFSFAITHEGVNINYDREVLYLVWNSGLRSWKKRLARFMVCNINFFKTYINIFDNLYVFFLYNILCKYSIIVFFKVLKNVNFELVNC